MINNSCLLLNDWAMDENIYFAVKLIAFLFTGIFHEQSGTLRVS